MRSSTQMGMSASSPLSRLVSKTQFCSLGVGTQLRPAGWFVIVTITTVGYGEVRMNHSMLAFSLTGLSVDYPTELPGALDHAPAVGLRPASYRFTELRPRTRVQHSVE